jgi:hypothetical protein
VFASSRSSQTTRAISTATDPSTGPRSTRRPKAHDAPRPSPRVTTSPDPNFQTRELAYGPPVSAPTHLRKPAPTRLLLSSSSLFLYLYPPPAKPRPQRSRNANRPPHPHSPPHLLRSRPLRSIHATGTSPRAAPSRHRAPSLCRRGRVVSPLRRRRPEGARLGRPGGALARAISSRSDPGELLCGS